MLFRSTHFVAGMGTGGTISGTGRYLKEHNPKVQVIGADPVGSILKHYKETGQMSEAHTYKIEGVGEDFIPTATDFSVVDRILSCNDHDGLNMARTLAREEAIFVGGSAGMAAWVALEVAKTCGPDDLVVVLLPDTGERYLTKVHNDEWMRDNPLPRVDLIKLLAQGEEFNALQGMRGLIERDRPKIFFLYEPSYWHRQGLELMDAVKFFADHG